jgi:DHA1 family tetracycline resistance protein-like MFS transporter
MIHELGRDAVRGIMKRAVGPVTVIAGLTFLTMFNLTFIVPSLKEVIIDRYDSTATMASLFVTVEMVAYIIFGVIWGALSDKRGERKVFIVVGFFGSALLYYAMSAAPDVTTMLALRFAQGSLTVMAWSLLMTMALDLAHADKYGAVMGIVGTGLALGIGLGAPIGGLVGDLGPLYPLYVASALFLFAAVLALLYVKDVPIKMKPESLATALRFISRDRNVIPPFLFGFAERFSAGYLVFLVPLYLAYEFEAGPSVRGMYLAAFLLPFAMLQYPFGKLSDRHGRKQMLVAGGFAYAVMIGFLGYSGQAGMVILMAASGAVAAMLLPASLGLLGDLAPKGERATYMGGFNALGSLGFAVAPPLATVLSEWSGYPAALAVGGAIIGVTVVLSVPFLGGMRPRAQECARGKPL